MQSLKFMRKVILRMRKTPCEHVLALFTNTNTGDKVGKPSGMDIFYLTARTGG